MWHAVLAICHGLQCALQSAVHIATELQKLQANLEQQSVASKQDMLQWLEAEKQQATQLVNAALEGKDAECQRQIVHACDQAHRSVTLLACARDLSHRQMALRC